MQRADLPTDLIPARDAATYVGLTLTTLSGMRWRRTGPPFYRINQRVWYSTADLNAYLDGLITRVDTAS